MTDDFEALERAGYTGDLTAEAVAAALPAELPSNPGCVLHLERDEGGSWYVSYRKADVVGPLESGPTMLLALARMYVAISRNCAGQQARAPAGP